MSDPTPSVDHNPAGEPGAKFRDWPTNLPREDLVRMLRGYAQLSLRVEQRIDQAFPDRFPLGDGYYLPTDQRLVVDESMEAMAELACEEIARLRAEQIRLTGVRAELRLEIANLRAALAKSAAVVEAAEALVAARCDSWGYRGLDDAGERALNALEAALRARGGSDD